MLKNVYNISLRELEQNYNLNFQIFCIVQKKAIAKHIFLNKSKHNPITNIFEDEP